MKLRQTLVILVLGCGSLRADVTPNPQQVVSVSTAATHTPLWEAGLVGAISYLPDYPAADQSRFKWIVAPYAAYRGKIMRADKDGARASMLRARRYEVDLGVAATFASDSDKNDARKGMPDIDYLLELGPRLNFLLSNLGGKGKLRLFLPVRAVFSTDFTEFRHRGFTLSPSINLRWYLRNSETLFITQLTSNFGNRQLSGYFYDVAPQFATTDRPFYDSRGGYMGSDIFTGFLIPIAKQLRLFTGLQALFHSGAANEMSPLFKSHVNYSAALGLVWMFYTSPRPAVSLD